jgi:hypothetical protein
MSVESITLLEIQRVAGKHQRRLAPLTHDLPLLNSGLDCLSLAVVVPRLDDQLGVDPFFSESVNFPVTLGDLGNSHVQTGRCRR